MLLKFWALLDFLFGHDATKVVLCEMHTAWLALDYARAGARQNRIRSGFPIEDRVAECQLHRGYPGEGLLNSNDGSLLHQLQLAGLEIAAIDEAGFEPTIPCFGLRCFAPGPRR